MLGAALFWYLSGFVWGVTVTGTETVTRRQVRDAAAQYGVCVGSPRAQLKPRQAAHGILAQIGRLIAPLFAPLGFGSWQMSTALLTGFTAKEAVVSTLAVLTGSSMATLPQTLSGALPLPAALAFLVFTLLYTPCVAAIAAVKREMGGARSALFVVFYQTAVAWVAAFLFYRLALLIW